MITNDLRRVHARSFMRGFNLAAKAIKFGALTLSALLFSAAVNAQSIGDLPADQRAQALQAAQAQQQQMQEQPVRTDWRTGNYGPVPDELNQRQRDEIKPFGADLFSGGFRGLRSDGLNPEYRVLPGDQVTLRIWGAIDVDRVLPVDAQGNIFIPSVGPVKVQGVSHRQLDATVRAAVRDVYPENVSVYTNLQGVQPVAVFVTGFVQKPGRYAGVPSDSILYFLDQASGIDEEAGSYRRVRLLRQGETIANIDLYEFIYSGLLDHPQLQDGDTLVVERRGPVVTVHGEVARAYHFELTESDTPGELITELAHLRTGVSHALIRGKREQRPFSRYLVLSDFREANITNGDEVLFMADRQGDSIVVQLEGAHLSQSYFVVPKDATLHELLNSIAINPRETAYEAISIRRESVAERQKVALEESLRRLETTYLGASSSTVEEATIRIREAELITQFVQRAREVEPNGRLVVSYNDQVVDIRLQDGDIVTLPQRTDSILVSGQVYIPQSAVYLPNKSARDYITGAGGFSEQADTRRILILRQNGEVRDASEVALRPGDEILVLPKVETKNLQTASAITQILYQVAVATRIALDL